MATLPPTRNAPPHMKGWEGASYPRYTRAPKRKYPSVSTASKTFHGPIFDMIVHDLTDLPSHYNLGTLLGYSTAEFTASQAEDAVKDYVQRILSDAVCVDGRKKMRIAPDVDTLAVSPTSIADDGICCSSCETELIYEVNFNKDWEATRDKLLVQLARMLTSLRNCYNPNDDINKVIGFYFPFHNTECVVQITVKWFDEFVEFREERRCLRQDEVESALQDAYQHNHQLLQRKGEPFANLNYPLSHSFLDSKGLVQIDSGQSIVLLDEEHRMVYKYAIDGKDGNYAYQRYLHFLMRGGPGPRTSTRIAFPIDSTVLGRTSYYAFKMYDPPLTKEDACDHIGWFVNEVVEAVKELHAMDIAHLDISLENICTDPSSNQLVLIDLNRSGCAQRIATSVYELYARHPMYTPGSNEWKLQHLDWKQVGLMITEIDSSQRTKKFIQKLISEGTYDQELHQYWNEEL